MNDYKNEIQVSVCVVTYNQEEYIAECLESLVHQVTNFKFEIIVGEDCSTDNTRSIVQQYVEKYPNLIVPLFHQNNVGAAENVLQVYKKAKGKYIAHIDGDDMALPNKLQKQFDTMEKNPQAIICSHKVLSLSEKNLYEDEYWNQPDGEYGFIDLVKKLPFFAHSSKFFKVVKEINLSSVLCNADVIDIELHLHQASNGTIIHLNENLGIYRTGVGITATKDLKINSKIVERVDFVYENLLKSNSEAKNVIEYSHANYLLNIAYSYAIGDSDAIRAKMYIIKSIKKKLISINQPVFCIIIHFPIFGIEILKTIYRMRK